MLRYHSHVRLKHPELSSMEKERSIVLLVELRDQGEKGKGQSGGSSSQVKRRSQAKGKGTDEERQGAEEPLPTPMSIPMSSSQSSSLKGKGREERYIIIDHPRTSDSFVSNWNW